MVGYTERLRHRDSRGKLDGSLVHTLESEDIDRSIFLHSFGRKKNHCSFLEVRLLVKYPSSPPYESPDALHPPISPNSSLRTYRTRQKLVLHATFAPSPCPKVPTVIHLSIPSPAKEPSISTHPFATNYFHPPTTNTCASPARPVLHKH